jgi:hypothetical protein
MGRMRLRGVGRAAVLLALVGMAVRGWRWLRSPGWTEDIEAVYGPSGHVTSGERITRAGVTTFLGGGEGGPPSA